MLGVRSRGPRGLKGWGGAETIVSIGPGERDGGVAEYVDAVGTDAPEVYPLYGLDSLGTTLSP